MGVTMGTRSLALACALSLMFLCGCSMPRIQIVMDGPEDTGPAEAVELETEPKPEPEDGAVALSGKTELACALVGDLVQVGPVELNVPPDFMLMETGDGFRQYYSVDAGMLTIQVSEREGEHYFDGQTPEEVEGKLEEITRDEFPEDLDIRWVEYTPDYSGISFTATKRYDETLRIAATFLTGRDFSAQVYFGMLPGMDEDGGMAIAEEVVDTVRLA